jgi:regulator of RNase E activity RraA
MGIQLYTPKIEHLDSGELAQYLQLPVAIIGDELNRAQIAHAAIRPLQRGTRIAGQALTVECMAGDNSALHYCLESCWPGAVIVCDARAHIDTAVWGEVMHTCAQRQGVGAVAIDGAIRDSSALAASALPVYTRGICPRGPHKGWGGSILGPIQFGGVAVNPGDLVVGDDDGLIIVRLTQIAGLVERCRERIEREAVVLQKLKGGETTVQALKLPPIHNIGR